jgi:hypothetical protein
MRILDLAELAARIRALVLRAAGGAQPVIEALYGIGYRLADL